MTQDQPDELDRLLEEAKTDDNDATIKVLQEIRKDQKEIMASQNAGREEKTRADVKAAVDIMREKIPEPYRDNPMFSPDAIEDYLTREAERDERLKGAFLGRHKDPGAWEAARAKVVDSFAKQFESMPDQAATEDREAVIASAETPRPADQEFDEAAVGKMSDAEFNKLQNDLGVAPFRG